MKEFNAFLKESELPSDVKDAISKMKSSYKKLEDVIYETYKISVTIKGEPELVDERRLRLPVSGNIKKDLTDNIFKLSSLKSIELEILSEGQSHILHKLRTFFFDINLICTDMKSNISKINITESLIYRFETDTWTISL